MADEISADVTGGENPSQVSDAPAVDQAAAQKLGWRSELPDDLKENEAFKPYATKKDLWKGHLELAEKVKTLDGKLATAITKPDENATPEQKEAFYKALGRPENADGYELKLPDGVEINQELTAWWKTYAFQQGLPKAVAESVYKDFSGLIVQMDKARADLEVKTHEEADAELKKTWGTDAPKNAETIKTVYQNFKNPAFDQLLQVEVAVGDKRVKIGDHPAMMAWALEVGKAMLSDNVPQNGPPKIEPPKAVGIVYPDMGGAKT